MTTWLTFQYTLTDTHLGGAGAVGAVDLPIVRESTTELPFLPDTALKGVARQVSTDLLTGDPKELQAATASDRRLFGRALGDREQSSNDSDAGRLVFTQGHLLLYPLRSLQRPFVYATCPLLLSRFDRLTRAFLGDNCPLKVPAPLLEGSGRVLVANEHLHYQSLVIEGAAWANRDVEFNPKLLGFAKELAHLFPQAESDTGSRVAQDLVLLPDADFVHLLRTAPPVRARISIDDDTGTTSGPKGNLWYEEMLPSDCLFWSVVQLTDHLKPPEAQHLEEVFKQLNYTQIGAGLTTGHGRAWWWRAAPGGKK